MKGFIGSANIDTNSRLCMSSSVAGHVRAFGEDVVPGCYEDLEEADLVVQVGSNMAWCHPVLYQRLMAAREKRGTRIVTIDPRRTATAETADLPSAARAGHAMCCCSTACWSISPTRTRSTATGSTPMSPASTTRLTPRARSAPSIDIVAAATDLDAGGRSRLLRSVRPHRAGGDALFPGRQPVRQRHRQGQRHHQLPSRHRPHRPARHGAVLAHRPAQRDGRARGRRPRQPARRAYGVRARDRRPRAPVLERAAHRGEAGPQGGRSVRSRRATAASRRSGSPRTNPADSMPRAGGCARRWRTARLSSSPIAGRPTPPRLPMSCCPPPAGARRTAPSPIPNAASRASAPSAPRRARPGPTGGCSRRWRAAWAGPTLLLTGAGRHFPRACRPLGLRE